MRRGRVAVKLVAALRCIAKAIVTAHGGDIEAIRLTGGGTRFEFTLPAAEPTP